MHYPKRVVVVGHGMVGHRFVEALRARDADDGWHVTVVAEEADAAYDRVGLTGYTEHWERPRLAMAGNGYDGDQRVDVVLRDRVTRINRSAKYVTTMLGRRFPYDRLVLATGSFAFVPPVPGHDLPGCHVYRTLDDLDAIRADVLRTMAAGATTGVVIGGGLLGIVAANALRGFGLHAHVVERAPRLMNQQLDTAGGALLQRMVTELGISVHLDVGTDAIEQCGADGSEGRSEATRESGSEGRSEATREGGSESSTRESGLRVLLSDGTPIDAGVVIFAAGVRPRDELAKAAGLPLAARGGVLTDLTCATEDPSIYAVGEVAAIVGRCYGLVGPGYTSAVVVSDRLIDGYEEFGEA
ncbi:MAG: nitrite reductase large subunit, partial [Mycobacterium sp.]|nr:nitrite reductase large subunit [Mycobacterium sp.]